MNRVWAREGETVVAEWPSPVSEGAHFIPASLAQGLPDTFMAAELLSQAPSTLVAGRLPP